MYSEDLENIERAIASLERADRELREEIRKLRIEIRKAEYRFRMAVGDLPHDPPEPDDWDGELLEIGF